MRCPWSQLPARPLEALQRPGTLSSETRRLLLGPEEETSGCICGAAARSAPTCTETSQATRGVLGTQTALPGAGATLSSVGVGFLSLETKNCPKSRNSLPEWSL